MKPIQILAEPIAGIGVLLSLYILYLAESWLRCNTRAISKWAVWDRVRPAGKWVLQELIDPCVCASCVYLGIISTALLPALLLLGMTGLIISPLAALPLTFYVFDIRAYPRWQAANKSPLGARILRALSDGVTWPRWWRRS